MVQEGDTVELRYAGQVIEGIVKSIEILHDFYEATVDVTYAIENLRHAYYGGYSVSSTSTTTPISYTTVSPSIDPNYRPVNYITYATMQPEMKFNVRYRLEEFDKLQPKNRKEVEIKDDNFWLN